MLQFVRGIERFGQALHQYGARADNTRVPFLRVPVPKNDKPHTISYEALGRVFDVLIADLDRAEQTLAEVQGQEGKTAAPTGRRTARPHRRREADRQVPRHHHQAQRRALRVPQGQQRLPGVLRPRRRGVAAGVLPPALRDARSVPRVDLEAFFDERVKDVFPKVEPSRREARRRCGRHAGHFGRRAARLGSASTCWPCAN